MYNMFKFMYIKYMFKYTYVGDVKGPLLSDIWILIQGRPVSS